MSGQESRDILLPEEGQERDSARNPPGDGGRDYYDQGDDGKSIGITVTSLFVVGLVQFCGLVIGVHGILLFIRSCLPGPACLARVLARKARKSDSGYQGYIRPLCP